MSGVFEWPLRVYIEDTDAGGIVYYVNYLKFIERARTEYLRSLGFGRQAIFSRDEMFVVHSLSSDYLKPARLDDQLVATAKVIKAGKAFLQLEQNVFREPERTHEQGERELLCRATVKLAYVSKQSMKPARIPEAMVAAATE